LNYKEEIEKVNNIKTLAFQGVFPNCYKYFNLIPSFWFSADPNGYIDGFDFLIKNKDKNEFKKMEIFIPNFLASDFTTYRQYCGTTPLGRTPGAWDKYISQIDTLKNLGFRITKINSTTTKYMKIHDNSCSMLNYDFLNKEYYVRFMSSKLVFGTVAYDSESVMGDMFKWGLENKLTSYVFPFCFWLRAKNVYIAGFDFKGPRFYSNIDRHPWNDESQKKNVSNFPLKLVEKWVEWEQVHGMKFYSVVEEGLTLLSDVIETKNMKEILRDKNA